MKFLETVISWLASRAILVACVIYVPSLGALTKTFFVNNGSPEPLSFFALEDGVATGRRSSLVVPPFSSASLVVDADTGGSWVTGYARWDGSTWVTVNATAVIPPSLGSDYELRYKCDASLGAYFAAIPHSQIEVERVPSSYWITLLSSGIAFGVFGGVLVVLMRLSRRSEEILRLS